MTAPEPSPTATRKKAPKPAVWVGVGVGVMVLLLAVATRRPAEEGAQPTIPVQRPTASGNVPIGTGPTGGPAPTSPITRPGSSTTTPGSAPDRPSTNPATGTNPPEVDPNELPPDHPPVGSASASASGSHVSLQWLGHACFYLYSPAGATAVMDPFDTKSTGLPAPDVGAHMVTVSSNSPDHSKTGVVHAFEGEKKEIVQGRELTYKDLRVLPVETSPGRYAYVLETGGFRVAHLGELERSLTADQAKRLGPVDVLLVPAGGEGISPKDAVAVAKLINPKIVIPMAYSTSSMQGPEAKLRPVDDFIAASPWAVTTKDLDTILLYKAELPKSTEVWTLRLRQ